MIILFLNNFLNVAYNMLREFVNLKYAELNFDLEKNQKSPIML